VTALRHCSACRSQASCSHAYALARAAAHRVPHVRTRADTRSRVRNRCRIADDFTHRPANELLQRAAGYNALHTVSARRRLAPLGGANFARLTGNGLAGEALRRRCGISGGRAAAKPAAATRARGRMQVCTGCHGCAHVRTSAHGCATSAALQTVSHFAVRTNWRSAQLVITLGVCTACVAESCREVGRSLLATPATTWQVKRSGRAAADAQSVGRAAANSSCSNACTLTRRGAHTLPHVRTRAHMCSRVHNTTKMHD
jgi:hypothetical protein